MTTAMSQGHFLENQIATRYSLLSRLKDWDDQDSWKDFFDTYWRLIHGIAIKSGLSESEAQDVVQETVITVAKDISKFKKDRSLGSFKGWLRNVVRWRIADQLRKRGPIRGRVVIVDELAGPILEQIPDLSGSPLEENWDHEWQKNLFDAAVARAKRKVKEEHFQIFDLYVIKEWPVEKVAKTLGVSTGQIYLAKHRVSAAIKKEIRALEKKPV